MEQFLCQGHKEEAGNVLEMEQKFLIGATSGDQTNKNGRKEEERIDG